MNENKLFEQQGLKIDKERVLTYSGLSCPLDCKYCFVNELNSNQQKGVAYLSEEQFELMAKLPEDVRLIMLGCDTEFFQSKKESIEILKRLVSYKKDISVITKLDLDVDFFKELSKVNNELKTQGNLLVFSETISCLDSYKKWEPKTPNPQKRIETLKNAYSAGLKTLVAIRPLLPDISDEELEAVISQTSNYCEGYYSGPLYLKDMDPELVNKEDENLEIIEEHQPHWMPDNNIFYKVENKGQMERLRQMVEKHGKKLFEGSAKGIEYIKTNE